MWLQEIFEYLITKKIPIQYSQEPKKKTSFESFMIFFDLRKIILSRSKLSFWVLPSGFKNPHNAIRNA
jgi:hypothetical protein